MKRKPRSDNHCECFIGRIKANSTVSLVFFKLWPWQQDAAPSLQAAAGDASGIVVFVISALAGVLFALGRAADGWCKGEAWVKLSQILNVQRRAALRGSLLAVASIDLAGMALPTIILLGVEMALGVPFLLFVEGWGSDEHVLLSFAGASGPRNMLRHLASIFCSAQQNVLKLRIRCACCSGCDVVRRLVSLESAKGLCLGRARPERPEPASLFWMYLEALPQFQYFFCWAATGSRHK